MNFMPHRMCFASEPSILWLMAISGAATCLAYFVIAEQTGIGKTKIRWTFAAFIMACGIGHGMSVLTLWLPYYWEQAIWSVVTAVISVCAAWAVATKRLQFGDDAINARIRDI